jgi:flavorubredoxin
MEYYRAVDDINTLLKKFHTYYDNIIMVHNKYSFAFPLWRVGMLHIFEAEISVKKSKNRGAGAV